jgi:hypothetical protein
VALSSVNPHSSPGVKVIGHLYLVPWLRICGVLCPPSIRICGVMRNEARDDLASTLQWMLQVA